MSVYSQFSYSPVRLMPNRAITANIPDSGITGGNARGTNAVDLQSSRVTSTQVASGNFSTIIGGLGNTSSGIYAVSGGVGCSASGFGSVALGQAATASGNESVAIGFSVTASGHTSWALGYQATTRAHIGRGAWASGQLVSLGDAQAGEYVLRRQTTDATITRLTADAGAAGSTNTINLPDFGCYSGRLTVIAKATGSTASAKWLVDLSAVRGSGAASVAVFEGAGASLTPTASNGTGSTWRLTIAADTTNGGIAVSVTGAAATTINWVARYANVEVVTAS